MSDFTKQFKKGVLELAILKLLLEEDQYGYSILQQVNKRSQNKLIMKEGTLYPIMYRLEDNNLIESYWKQGNTTRSKPRKYYRITDDGKTRFDDMYQDFSDVFEGITRILNEVKAND